MVVAVTAAETGAVGMVVVSLEVVGLVVAAMGVVLVVAMQVEVTMVEVTAEEVREGEVKPVAGSKAVVRAVGVGAVAGAVAMREALVASEEAREGMVVAEVRTERGGALSGGTPTQRQVPPWQSSTHDRISSAQTSALLAAP